MLRLSAAIVNASSRQTKSELGAIATSRSLNWTVSRIGQCTFPELTLRLVAIAPSLFLYVDVECWH